MTRFFLWLLLFWVVWRVYRSVTGAFKKQKKVYSSQQQQPPQKGSFSHIQDAEYEDVTPKSEEKH